MTQRHFCTPVSRLTGICFLLPHKGNLSAFLPEKREPIAARYFEKLILFDDNPGLFFFLSEGKIRKEMIARLEIMR